MRVCSASLIEKNSLFLFQEPEKCSIIEISQNKPGKGRQDTSKTESERFRVRTDGVYGELFVPMELRSTKFFKGERGKNKEGGRKARMNSLTKTLEFFLKW